ncbi:hypothetical protein Tcan_03183 [Toxocara canis]|uniref:Apolipoprotein L3 n=1 Tax=Toxocara canis TaxID=6265 RepID=A0A0B2V140_TOXCA|nr:hypothetical protein Tcan_03183 [Toxocara canis]
MTVDDEKEALRLPRQSTLSDEERQLLREQFRVAFEAFVDNRRKLIWELEKIADKAIGLSKGCAISKLAGSSVGLGGGAAALAGLVAFPPVVVFGGIAAGMAAIWNIGTQVVEYKLSPSELTDEAKQLSEKDTKLVVELNSIYQKLFKADMASREVGLAGAVGRGASEMIGSGAEFAAIAGRRAARMFRSGRDIANAEKGTAEMAGSGIEIAAVMEEGAAGVIAAETAGVDSAVATGATAEMIGSAGGEVATAAGVGSAEMVGLGSQVLQGVAQGAIVFGVAMDIVSIISSARTLSKGSRTKFSDFLRAEVKRREVELDSIRKRATDSGLIESPKPVQLHLMEPAKHI